MSEISRAETPVKRCYIGTADPGRWALAEEGGRLVSSDAGLAGDEGAAFVSLLRDVQTRRQKSKGAGTAADAVGITLRTEHHWSTLPEEARNLRDVLARDEVTVTISHPLDDEEVLEDVPSPEPSPIPPIPRSRFPRRRRGR